jgi:protein-disulfide isomerase
VNRTQLLIGLVVIAVVAMAVAGYFAFFTGSGTDAAASAPDPMAITLGKDDRTLGSPKAPLTVVEYAAPSCPICAHFEMDMLPQFKQRYIDTGKIFFVFRVFPLRAVDVAAEAMARCLPEDNYFQFLDMMYRNQSKWDPDGYEIPDQHAALLEMGRIAGMNSQQVDTCIADQAAAKRIEQVGTYAQTNYGINGTPTFVVKGQLHMPFRDFDDVRSFFDPLVAKK